MPESRSKAVSDTQTQNIFGRPLTIFGVPVDRKIIFSDHKGRYKNRIEKRQRKLIVKTTFIKFFLLHNECIRCLTTGYSPISALEQVFTGLAFLFFKRAIFVFTDKRILHIPTRFNRSSFGAVSQIWYEDCANINLKGRTLIVKYKNGSEEQFPYIGRKERKKLKVLLAAIQLKPKAAGNLNARVSLCPSCTNVLDPKSDHCPTCKLKFKSGFQAKLRSLLIPGGGYFYSRHSILGTLLGIVEIALVTKLILDGIAWNEGFTVDLGFMALVAFTLMAAKLISAYHTEQLTKKFIPEPKDFAVRKI
ncbi:MAG: hypothetical protein P8X96_21755 [Desulfobacteraceae bacterium]|jgi:hypothetical protein